MQFREIKAGGLLYIYNRQKIELSTSKAISVSAPRLDKSNGVATMVVDIAIDGVTYTFKDTSEVGYTSNLVISSDRSKILQEVESQKEDAENLLSKVEITKQDLPRIEKVLDLLNPSAKEKKEIEERFARLEGSLGKISEAIDQLIKVKK